MTDEKPKRRYLTKSLFVRALGCPTKIFYAKKPLQYPDNSLDDEFLESLAEGGFQVGALAQCYFPGGHTVAALDPEAAVAETSALLSREQVTIFEAAIRHGPLFIRVDILVKNGSVLDLIEVKAKSCDADEDLLSPRTHRPRSEWKPYLYDVAFQKHVLRLALPKSIIRAHLMLADKSARASVDGLNQRFRIEHCGNRTRVCPVGTLDEQVLGTHVLIQRNVDAIVNDLIDDGGNDDTMGMPFADFVDLLASRYVQDLRIATPVGAKCKSCEFKATAEQEAQGLCSGFNECWKPAFNLSAQDFLAPNIFHIWNCRRSQQLIETHKFLLRNITPEEITSSDSSRNGPGMTAAERQILQLEKAQRADGVPFVDHEGLASALSRCVYPLHFIDFETSAVALPFHAGRHPYEGIAFQFSHHTMDADGRIRHAGQYLDAAPGRFPNYDFLRALKRELERDQGTILRYAAHENTFLLHIYDQLQDEETAFVPDRDPLCEWIRTVTTSKKNPRGEWAGPRSMVDMRELVLRYYYDPFTRGSNSIKAVLPAALRTSERLKARYSQPIYGAAGGIPSLNYRDWRWVEPDADGQPRDPYKLLPPISLGIAPEQLQQLEEAPHLDNGGAAMMAYARLQFEDVPAPERQATEHALLRYCELDTMAMVMIWEHWLELLGRARRRPSDGVG